MACSTPLRILVAGGAGFIGSNLVEYLLKEKHLVTLLDSFTNGLEDNIAHLTMHPKLELLRYNVQDPLPNSLVFDQIYHLACPASPKHYQKDPVQTLRTCFIGTQNLLDLAVRCHARLLISSTSEVYGDPLVSPQPESYHGNVNSYGPRACYDEGKRAAEALCYAYQDKYDIDVRIARIFNAYGPGMPASDGRVISSFVSAALDDNAAIHITGDGSAIRCFQYISDCISGLTKLMASDYSKPMNIGNDIPCKIGDLANLVADLVVQRDPSKHRTLIKYGIKPIDDPITRQPDISLAEEVLQWRPTITLEAGLQKTIEWFSSLPERPAMRDIIHKVPFHVSEAKGTELSNIQDAIHHLDLSGGASYSQKCQKLLRELLNCGPVYLTSSGTSALEIAALTLDINPGDEVILPSYTFVSTANAFVLRGATLIFVDIRKDTMNIDENKIEEAITDQTKVILPVHYAGVPCEMDKIMEIANKHQLMVVEDAAQGLLSTYKGRALGSIGHIGCLSFHGSKNITSGGQGGAILINDEGLTERAEIMAEKGTNRSQFLRGNGNSYQWLDVASGSSMSEVQAAYLWSQLETVDLITSQRLKVWNRYHQSFLQFQKTGHLFLQTIPDECHHNAHIYFIRLRIEQDRKAFMDYMKGRGVITTSHYQPLHECPPGKKHGRFVGENRYTTTESSRLVRLPIFHTLSQISQDSVVTAVKSYFSERPIAKL